MIIIIEKKIKKNFVEFEQRKYDIFGYCEVLVFK